MVTRQGIRILVPKRSKRGGEGRRGSDGSADDHQPPDPFAGGGRGRQAVRHALLLSGRSGEP